MSGYPTDPGSPAQEPRPDGSMPPPAAGETAAALPEPPMAVRRAATILYISAGLAVIGLLLSLATRSSTEEAIRAATPSLTGAEVETAATLQLVVGGVVGLAFGFLYYLCGRKMLQGRSWARLVPTVLIGIGVLFSAVSLSAASAMTTTALISVLISLALGVAFLVSAWSRPSNDFFKAARVPR